MAIVIAIFPFSLLLPISAWDEPIKRYFKKGVEAVDRWKLFAFLWMLFPVVFFSFSGSKLPGYILPAVPGAALLLATDLEKVWTNDGKQTQWIALTVTAVLLIFGAITLPFLKKINIDLSFRLGLATVLMIGGAVIGFGSIRRSG